MFIRRINSQIVEIGTIPLKKEHYKAKNFIIHTTKLQLHQRQGDRRPQTDPKQLPQFTPEEQTLARDHTDSWIDGADLEHVKVVAKTLSPPANQEPSRAGPMRTGREGGGGGSGPPSPLKTLAGGPPNQPR